MSAPPTTPTPSSSTPSSTGATTPTAPTERALRAARWAATRLARRARFLTSAALVPGLGGVRGTPVALGPRVHLDLGPGARFERGPRCTIAGDFHGSFQGRVTWGEDVFVNVGGCWAVHEEVRLGDRVLIGERVSVHDEDHRFEPVGSDRGAFVTAPVVIGDDVWIGAGSIVLRGTTIGEGCVVAAGSVVKGDFPPHQLIAGTPARVVRPLRTA